MGTKAQPGEFDCYANAEPDEPMFILLARDKHAPTLVWLWATLRELDGEDEAKVAEARACVGQMIEWAHRHDRRSVGLGQSVLAGVMELIRTINIFKDADTKNLPTDDGALRMFLGVTETDPPPPQAEGR